VAATDRHRRTPRRRRPSAGRLVLAVVAVVAGAAALLAPAPAPAGTPATAAASGAEPGPLVALQSRTPGAVAEPIGVRVPAIGVDAPLERLGVDAAGALATPADYGRAGWFDGGPAPGAVGPAVLVGHVDSTAGPAVFWRLRELAAGAEVLVDRADGTTARFVVTRVERHPKDDFPTDEVYGPTPEAQLRLITCGGGFDRSQRSYRDNVVVFAQLG
jgi:hypothetical protein